jgi:predicted membrane metal-binding protein
LKNILDKIFSLNALAFVFVLFAILVVVLLFTPVEGTLAGGLFLFAIMVGGIYLAYKEYNKRNGN